jgi:hypothetical protein
MPRCGRPASRAVSRPVCADETNRALSVDRKHLGTSAIGPHPARSVSAVAPRDPPRSAVACRSAIGRPILGATRQWPAGWAIRRPCPCGTTPRCCRTTSAGWPRTWSPRRTAGRQSGAESGAANSRIGQPGAASRERRNAHFPRKTRIAPDRATGEIPKSRGDTIRTCDLYVPNVAL